VSEDKEFDKALERMKSSFAGKDGIIHLFEQGYSFGEIQSSMDFPFSMEKIGRTVWEYLISNETILLRDPLSGQGKENATYVKTVGAYGKQSFVKVVGDETDEKTIRFRKMILNVSHDIFDVLAGTEIGKVEKFIKENSSGGPDYVSVDFGRLKTRSGNEWITMLSSLSGEERDYVENLPWQNSLGSVYHKIDDRLIKVLYSLERSGFLPGVYYFAVNE